MDSNTQYTQPPIVDPGQQITYPAPVFPICIPNTNICFYPYPPRPPYPYPYPGARPPNSPAKPPRPTHPGVRPPHQSGHAKEMSYMESRIYR